MLEQMMTCNDSYHDIFKPIMTSYFPDNAMMAPLNKCVVPHHASVEPMMPCYVSDQHMSWTEPPMLGSSKNVHWTRCNAYQPTIIIKNSKN